MNSEKVLRKDYKKQSILTVLLIISIILCLLIYLLTKKIDGAIEVVFILLIVLMILIILCLIGRLLSNGRMKKAIINYPDIYDELDNINTISFPKYGFYFTNKYFITSKTFNIFKYSDILWLYYSDRKNKKAVIGKDINIGLNNGNIYNIWTINIKEKDNIKNIEKEFINRVENIIIGNNDKNKKKYYELIKK